jgi:hypothetical protein
MLERKYNVKVDYGANDRMYDHIRFLTNVSIEAADNLYDSLVESINELETNPGICPLYTSWYRTDIKLHYKMCGKRYRIVFEIIVNEVYVYDIQDCRQDIDKNLI